MRRTLLLAALLCLGSLVVAQTPDTPGNRLAQAELYVKESAFEQLLRDTAGAVAKNFPEPDRPAIVELFIRYLDLERIQQAMVASVSKHFTVAEIQAMRDFYGSPTGKSILSKFAAYMGDVMPTIQTVTSEAAAKLVQDLKSRQR